MSNNGDEELEHRLRDVLSSRGLGVPVSPDAIDRIHAGARRRQQRRTVASALGAVAIIAIAAIAIGVRPHGHGSTLVAHNGSPSPTAVVSSSPPASPSAPIASPAVIPSAVASTAVVVPTAPAVASTPPVQVFNPVSVSAISVNDYWVLGYITADSGPNGISIRKTTDAGQHFTTVGHPAAFVAQMNARVPPGTPMVSDVRFGDTNNGWAYGGNLFATEDGGTSWSPVTGVPGSVVDLAAASGNVWAISDVIANGTDTYSLYHATYGASGTSAWARVDLGVTPAGGPTSVAVINKTAYVLEGSGSQQKTYGITNGGGNHTTQPGPCATMPTLGGGELSVAGDGSLWAWCTSGHESGVFVSADNAVHWQGMVRTTTLSVGGIDSSHAVVSDGTSIGILTLGHSVTTPTIPDTSGQPDAAFVGFTTTQIGFVVTGALQSPTELWRTTAGGQTWSVVTF